MGRWRWLIGVLCIGWVMAGCGPPPSPTPTLTPSLTPTSTATATPTPTLTPTPGLDDISIALQISGGGDDGRIPADSTTTVAVVATLNTPPGLNLDGLTLYFTAEGGGSFTPVSAPIAGRIAASTYTAGESPDTSTVTLRALVDVPDLGRVEAATTLELVRENLTLDLPCGYAFLAGRTGDLAFELVSDQPDLGGQYTISVALTGAAGAMLTTTTDNVPARLLRQTVSPGPVSFRFTHPPAENPLEEPMGSGEVCVSLPDRPIIAPVCRPVIWGPGAATLDVRTHAVVHWAQQPNLIPELRARLFEAPNVLLDGLALGGYRVVAAPAVPADGVYVTEVRNALGRMDVVPPGDGACVTMPRTYWGTSYIGFQPWHEAWVAEMQVLAPDAAGGVLTHTAETIVAAQSLRVVDYGATFFLEDGGTLTLNPALPAPQWRVYARQRYNVAAESIPVLVRVYARQADLDRLAAAGAPPSPTLLTLDVTTHPNYAVNSQVNATIVVQNPSFDLYSMSEPSLIASDQTQWRTLYFYAYIDPAAVQIAY